MTAPLLRDCIFVGGIHGVGKSSLCTDCASSLKIANHTASELIRRYNDRDAGLYKEVISVSGNQDSLINALRALRTSGPYLLDGHFAIRSKTAGISVIPLATFEAIAPRGIIVVTGDPAVAARRMLERDGKCVSASQLGEMQRMEIDHGRLVARELDVRIVELHSPSLADFASSVSSLIAGSEDSAKRVRSRPLS